MDYYYNLDRAWKLDGLYRRETSVVKGTTATHVLFSQNEEGFIFKLTGYEGVFWCHYGWAFVELNPDNEKRLREYQKARKKADAAEKSADALWKKVKTFAPHYEKPGLCEVKSS